MPRLELQHGGARLVALSDDASYGPDIIMEKFDPEHYLTLVEKYCVTHTQPVPTMFSRMLKLPDEVREAADVSSLEVGVHAAAPCPVQVKEQVIDWWGPIILEYYSATETIGFSAYDSGATTNPESRPSTPTDAERDLVATPPR